jgi:hypothetical protein
MADWEKEKSEGETLRLRPLSQTQSFLKLCEYMRVTVAPLP